MLRRFLVGLAAFLALAAAPAAADIRRALVIGNDAYHELPRLMKAVNDANAVAETLHRLGFEVTKTINATERQTAQVVGRFAQSLEPGDTAFVFFAGHGVEIDGQNYLLPVDTPKARPGDEMLIRSEAIALADMLDTVRARGSGLTIAVIDACRDNPFEINNGRSVGGRSRGLAMVQPPQGTFIIYSAGAGQAALDRLDDEDADRNSVFTRKLLPLMEEPGLDIRRLAVELRRKVNTLAASVAHRQTPAYYDELLGDFAFIEGREPAEPRPVTATTAPVAPSAEAETPAREPLPYLEPQPPLPEPESVRGQDPAPPPEDIGAAFRAARAEGTMEAWRRFLAAHGASGNFAYVQTARDELRKLEIRATF